MIWLTPLFIIGYGLCLGLGFRCSTTLWDGAAAWWDVRWRTKYALEDPSILAAGGVA